MLCFDRADDLVGKKLQYEQGNDAKQQPGCDHADCNRDDPGYGPAVVRGQIGHDPWFDRGIQRPP